MTTEFDLGGKRFKMRELTDEELERLDEWVASRFVRVARESLSDDQVGTEAWDKTIVAATHEAMRLTWSRGTGFVMLFGRKRGLARVVSAGCDGSTIDDVYAHLKTPRDVETARSEFMLINGVEYKAPAKQGVAESYGNPTSVAVP
jgi:hypothetical protein